MHFVNKKVIPKSVFLAQPLSKVDYLVKKGMKKKEKKVKKKRNKKEEA